MEQITERQIDQEVLPIFFNKIKISETEASETVYWLEIIKDLNWVDENLFKPVYDESNELLAIFTTIKNKLKTK